MMQLTLSDNDKNFRNSGIELLRLIAIFLVICSHYSAHGGYVKFNVSTLTNQEIFITALAIFGKVACSIFAIITGFFMVNKTGGIIKRNIPLIINLFFYSILIFVIFVITGLTDFSITKAMMSFMPIVWGNWYVVGYLIFSLFIPYINKFLRTLSLKEFSTLILIVLLVWSVIPTVTKFAYEYSNFDFFIVMYLIGAYIKIFEKKFNNQSVKFYFFVMIFSALFLIGSVVILCFLSKIFNIYFFLTNAKYFGRFNSIPAVIFAISSFLFFYNLKFKCKIVNKFSTSVLGILLIHDNFLVRELIWQKIFPNVDYLNTNYLILHVIIKIILVFILSLFIDQIKIITIDKFFNILIKKISNNISKRRSINRS